MAKNTEIYINEIEKRLLWLINQFGIKIEKLDHGTLTNYPDMIRFSFWPDKSGDILKLLKFQFVILEVPKNNLFEFDISY